ncbi:hypothetical protein HMSSN036_80410 [Paenibacillus macerans]|nr:hypothetical protein HMSSN036_80410 [Paenibacillus macerans]
MNKTELLGGKGEGFKVYTILIVEDDMKIADKLRSSMMKYDLTRGLWRISAGCWTRSWKRSPIWYCWM